MLNMKRKGSCISIEEMLRHLSQKEIHLHSETGGPNGIFCLPWTARRKQEEKNEYEYECYDTNVDCWYKWDLIRQVCVQLPTSAVDVTLLAFAAERRAAGRPAAAAVDQYPLPAWSSAACRWCGRRTGQTGRQTDGRTMSLIKKTAKEPTVKTQTSGLSGLSIFEKF